MEKFISVSALTDTMDDVKQLFTDLLNEEDMYSDVRKAQYYRDAVTNLAGKLAVEVNELILAQPKVNQRIAARTNAKLDELKLIYSSTEAQKRIKGELNDLYLDQENIESYIKSCQNLAAALRMKSDSIASLINILLKDKL
jgi:predicted component of type VI protein secretion system